MSKLRCSIIIYLLSCSSAVQNFLRPGEDLGVHHVVLPGSIPRTNGSDTVLLHIFMTIDRKVSSTLIEGYFFAESASLPYHFTPWGQASQPPSVRQWNFPVMFKDLESGLSAAAAIPGDWWRVHAKLIDLDPKETRTYALQRAENEPLHYPIVFSAELKSHVSCVEVQVKDWLHTRELCFGSQPNVLSRIFAKNQAVDPHQQVWSVLAPYRSYDRIPEFISTLIHHTMWHLQVGFKGTVLYASTFLIDRLLKSDIIFNWVQEGKMLLCLWDDFNKFQEVVSNQVYYAVPDQILVNNHALLVFKKFERAIVFIGDVDEFFVPRRPIMTVQELFHGGHEDCFVSKDLKEWGAIDVYRRNFRSSISRSLVSTNASDSSESTLWKMATQSPECSPLQTYHMAATRPVGKFKPFISPSRGVLAWHVHHGVFDSKHAEFIAKEKCAFVLHVVNLWSGRLDPEIFTQSNRMKEFLGVHRNYSMDKYAERCLPSAGSPSTPGALPSDEYRTARKLRLRGDR